MQLNAKCESLLLIKKDFPKVYADFIDALAHAIATVTTLLNPSVIVLGGGIVQSEPWLIDEILPIIRQKSFAPSFQNLKIEISQFENAVLEGVFFL